MAFKSDAVVQAQRIREVSRALDIFEESVRDKQYALNTPYGTFNLTKPKYVPEVKALGERLYKLRVEAHQLNLDLMNMAMTLEKP